MLKRKLLGAVAALCMLPCMAAAQQAGDCFVNMPDSMSVLLTAVDRADCVDFLNSRMKARVKNRLGGTSEMTVLTDTFIEMQMTESSTWQMKLLPVGDSLAICTVTTVMGPVPDSRVEFFTTSWEPLPAAAHLPKQPVANDYFLPLPSDAGYDLIDARRDADFLMQRAALSPDGNTLTFRLTTPQLLEKRAAQLIEPYVLPAITYVWGGGQFRPQAAE